MQVQVTVTNRTAYLQKPYPSKQLRPYWSYSVPGFKHFSQRYPHWNGRIQMLKHHRLPAGLFWATKPLIEGDYELEFVVEEKLEALPVQVGAESEGKYEFQNQCVDAMVQRLPYGGGLILNATGSGKTRMTGMLFSRLKAKTCFVVDQLDLLEQAQKEMADVLRERVGYVGNSQFRIERNTVATVQTMHLHRHDPVFVRWMREVEVNVIDEIHVQMAKRNFDVVESFKPKAVFGLTATLQLTQKPIRVRAWSIAGPVCYEYPLERGMEEGVLSKGVVVRIMFDNAHEVDL